jgi:hypothetical protein
MPAQPHDDALDALALVDAAGLGDWPGLALLLEHADLRAVSARLAFLAAQLLEDAAGDGDDPRAFTYGVRMQLILGAG